ncbi:hypothetical protein RND81_12G028600 [Saponaria officinalis]|uniref:Rapid ALkalinization Factor n=1 Tax=Saponaria officinalis TaxID=3572 RepID=A0AAW1H4G4_SAPOF
MLKSSTTKTLLISLLIIQTHFNISNGYSDSLKSFDFDQNRVEKSKTCTSIEEIEGDFEVNRRKLSGEKRYISYETLKRDVVPCSIAGSSYYKCGVSPANHYSRGCSVITQCARFY